MRLRVDIKPDRNVWKWRIDAWYTDEEIAEYIDYGRDKRSEGWYYAGWAIPHDLGEFLKWEGTARNEEKARRAARKALHDTAGRLAVAAFDKGLGHQQGYVVEV